MKNISNIIGSPESIDSGYRILYLTTDTRIGGAERVILTLSKRLDKKRFAILVCCLSQYGPFVEELKDADIRVVYLGGKGPWDIRVVWRLIFLLKRENPDILHSHLFHSNILGRIIGRLCRVRIIISTEHIRDMEGRLRVLINRLTAPLCNRIIAVSYSIKEFLVKRARISKDKIMVIQNGIEIDCLRKDIHSLKDLKSALGISKGEKVVGTVGRLSYQKGQRYFLLAAKEVLKAIPEVKFVVVGEGRLKGDLIGLSYNLGIGDKVIFTGFRRDISDILDILDVFVLSSLWEGLPIGLLEAMGRQRPSVVSDLPGMDEVIDDGIDGYRIAVRDYNSLAQRIIQVLSNPEQARYIGLNARDKVIKRFAAIRMAEETERLYDEIIRVKV